MPSSRFRSLSQRCKPCFGGSRCLIAPFYVVIMPMMEITEEQAAAALATMHDALDSLLINNDIPKGVRAVLGHIGVRRLPNLANYESTEDKFREAMANDVGLQATDAPSRILLSNLIECWKSARNRLKTKDDEDAVARAQGRPAPLSSDAFVAMRRAWEAIHGEKTDVGFPSKYYINRRLRQLECGELKPEKLTEVTSVQEGGDEDDDRELDLVITGNAFRATRKHVAVPLPAPWDTEAFRNRMHLMKIHWDVAVAQYSDKRAFTGYDRELWTRHVEYLLGEDIFGYRACGLRLGWDEFLEYEWTIRKAALKRVNRGEATLMVAMTEALTDPNLKQLHFTLPLTTMGKRESGTKGQGKGDQGKRTHTDGRVEQELKRLRAELQNLRDSGSASSSNQPHYPAATPATTPKKGKSKGKGKSSGAGDNPRVAELREMRQREKLQMNMPNGGGLICYYYNVGSCSRGRDCRFHHVCMRCLGEGHTALDKSKCKQPPQPK